MFTQNSDAINKQVGPVHHTGPGCGEYSAGALLLWYNPSKHINGEDLCIPLHNTTEKIFSFYTGRRYVYWVASPIYRPPDAGATQLPIELTTVGEKDGTLKIKN